MKKLLTGILIPGAIVLTGIGAFALLKSLGAPPARVERRYSGPLAVEISPVCAAGDR